MLPIIREFTYWGLGASSLRLIAVFTEFWRISRLRHGPPPENSTALPLLTCPLGSVGAANQLFSSVTSEIGPLKGCRKMSKIEQFQKREPRTVMRSPAPTI